MTVQVDPTAVVSAGARLAEGVVIGPYAVVGEEVVLGSGTTVGAHAHLEGPAVLGEKNRVFPHAVIGFEPQDLKFHGEKTRLVIGAGNVFREFSTVHRGTATGRGETVIGDGNLFMAYSHVAHDCRIGSAVVLANYAALAGHVDVEDAAILGAYVGAHQFIRVGTHAFVGAYSALRQDVLPFCRTDGAEPKTYGLNTIGLKRAGFSRERIEALEKAYRLLVKSKLNTSQALERISGELPAQADVEHLVNFVRGSTRGFHR
ncbi:MAG TPA: acyl-ACP--UDP-N-acetylglucosamine O-acyltransferase [Thermoanaerobaculia bacterium]|nr:acyl-ACP--UDP-N-acetylglucosamine O-acyltransferase [Thermoanaerobaculia bacterium]